jgi:beta-galactosidase
MEMRVRSRTLQHVCKLTASVGLMGLAIAHAGGCAEARPVKAAAAMPAKPTAAQAARPTLVLADGWRFRLDPAASGPEQPAFDDSAWATVSVPHTWNRVGYYRSDPATHLNTAQSVDKTMGVGWYRLAFRAPSTFKGKRAYLQFDAASRIADVWLNAVALGKHKGGFSRFRFDATDALRPDGQNVLVVKVDNARPEPGSSTADVLPLAGDFFVHGGLYRPVSLIATDAVHFDMLDHGGSGVSATTVLIEGKQAAVRVRAKLRNDGTSAQAIRVVARLVDPAGRVVASAAQVLTVSALADTAADAMLHLTAAHLWSGTADPYLYRLVAEIQSADGHSLDTMAQPLGVRQMAFDPARGFMLNGKPYALHGVGYHQDREGKGWAIAPQDVEGDFATLREMGANTIRLTHYQHGQTVHDLADRYGFVLWDEIPLVSQWTLGGAKGASSGLLENARQQLAEEIAQDSNHASVATWSIANEVDFGNSLPGFVTGYTGTPPDPAPLLAALNELARELDPSRPTALATCCEGRVFGAGVDVPITAPQADLGGTNRYYGWYYGKPDDLGTALDAIHAKRPVQPLALTEYGAGGAINIHTDNPTATAADSRGRKQPEEVESMIHERNWAAIVARPWLWASWLWSGFDFASTIRHEGDAEDINTKGLVTYDHKTRKDAYYFYKANWNAAPTVYIAGRRYADRAYAVTDIKVYSNAPTTVLSVNGHPIGERNNCALRICVWKAVHLDAGRNGIVAEGRFAGGKVADRVNWTLEADAARGFRIDAGALVAATGTAGRFGSDDFFEGGEAGSADKPADYGKPAKPTPIAGTGDRDIAATYRQGKFAYHVPVPNGRYTVRLTFVEPSAATGERVFDVTVNDVPVLTGLDIAKEGGGALVGLQRSFDVDVHGGKLDLAFQPRRGDAIVSAIEVLPR